MCVEIDFFCDSLEKKSVRCYKHVCNLLFASSQPRVFVWMSWLLQSFSILCWPLNPTHSVIWLNQTPAVQLIGLTIFRLFSVLEWSFWMARCMWLRRSSFDYAGFNPGGDAGGQIPPHTHTQIFQSHSSPRTPLPMLNSKYISYSTT